MRALCGTDDVGRPKLFDLVGSCLVELSRNGPLVRGRFRGSGTGVL
jgi:hypothetical protein